jgi:beta-glucosidase
MSAAAGRAEDWQYPFQNPELPMEDRINKVISLMTLDEKIGFLTARGGAGVPRLGIPSAGRVEGLHGLAMGGLTPTTIFPQAIGMAEMWDPEVLRQAAAVEGYETRYVYQCRSGKFHPSKYKWYGLVVRAPDGDLGRDPRWGRTGQCSGEDPFFNGTMCVAFVRGLQGGDPKHWMCAALLKHFFAYNNENGRYGSSSDFDERLFREYYSVPFRMGFAEGGARCFMASYNAWNKVPCAVHPVIKDVAINEWGVDGIITTDGDGFEHLFQQHHYFANAEEAAAGCVKAGVNQISGNYSAGLSIALKDKLVSEADIDTVVKGTLRISARLGLLDPPEKSPYARIGQASEAEPWTTEKHKAIARLATQKSIVLLKHSRGLLPLDKTKLKSVAVIGPWANEVLLEGGRPPYTVTPLDGIRSKVGTKVAVNFVADNTGGQAARLARSADVAIVCVGNHPAGGPGMKGGRVQLPSDGKEGVDRKSIDLEQEELIRQVWEANPRTIVALISSFPYAINWTQQHVPAIVHLTQCSQELGNALADVLFGDYNPAGRLVQTWPRSLEQVPPMMDYDIRHGRTYMYFKGEPLYPFGYGLSYTTFDYSNLKTNAPTLSVGGAITATVEIKNTGPRAGEEVAQFYVKHLGSKVDRPIKELKGFKRVALEPGESKTVEFPLTAESLAYWGVDRHTFVVEPGRVELSVGGSSADQRLKTEIAVQSRRESR